MISRLIPLRRVELVLLEAGRGAARSSTPVLELELDGSSGTALNTNIGDLVLLVDWLTRS